MLARLRQKHLAHAESPQDRDDVDAVPAPLNPSPLFRKHIKIT
jgi:hypothetical protein